MRIYIQPEDHGEIIAKLYEMYPPDIICYSPQTSDLVEKITASRRTEGSPMIILDIDVNLSDFKSNLISEEESIHHLDLRVFNHNAQHTEYEDQNSIVWHITHYYFIRRLMRSLGFDPSKFKGGRAIIVRSDSCEVIYDDRTETIPAIRI